MISGVGFRVFRVLDLGFRGYDIRSGVYGSWYRLIRLKFWDPGFQV